MRLTLKPFGPVAPEVLRHLRSELTVFDEIVIAPAAEVPLRGYEPSRQQYRASSFFEACKAEPGERVLGVTEADLYDEAGDGKDLDFVFGFAQIGDRAAVISLARLRRRSQSNGRNLGPVRLGERGRQRFLDRCVKEAVHELGHTLGLQHDWDRPDCVMYHSRKLRDTDRKRREYCPMCSPQAELTLSRLRT